MPQAAPVPAEPAKQEPGSALLKALSDTVSEPFRSEQSALLRDATAFAARVDDFLARVHDEKLEGATAEHADLKEQCRRQRATVARLREENLGFLTRLSTITMNAGGPLSELREAEGDFPSEDDWPTDKQLQTAQARIDRAREAFRKSEEEKVAAVAAYNESCAKLAEEAKLLASLASKEKLLRGAIRGEIVRDPETGLSAVPRL